jgi:hypothetical protein
VASPFLGVAELVHEIGETVMSSTRISVTGAPSDSEATPLPRIAVDLLPHARLAASAA